SLGALGKSGPPRREALPGREGVSPGTTLARKRPGASQRDRARDPALQREPDHTRELPGARSGATLRPDDRGPEGLARRLRPPARRRRGPGGGREEVRRQGPGPGQGEQVEGGAPARPDARPVLLAPREVRDREAPSIRPRTLKPLLRQGRLPAVEKSGDRTRPKGAGSPPGCFPRCP